MVEIKLEHGVWTLDEGDALGPSGGFGDVFRGRGPDGEVAIKRLKISAAAAAHRELKIGKELSVRHLEHVVPIIDFGQDADSDRYYLVMPICEYSLQDCLNGRGPLTWDAAKPIALDIIAGLLEVEDIVHRDLKPGNVLWYQNKWQVADFGIAKFVEDSTSIETLRQSLTPAYAAPEQWLGEAPTRATDVYALGCILHTMINGRPPFGGDLDTIRYAHLHESPPELEGTPPRLGSLVSHMLRKSAASRPKLDRCAIVFNSIEAISAKQVNAALAEAGQLVAQQEAEAESKRRAEESASRARADMGTEANRDLERMFSDLFDQIEATSEAINRQARAISLGSALLSYSQPELIVTSKLQDNVYIDSWDILAHSKIGIRSKIERYSHSDAPDYSFSATLVFAKNTDDQEYRWREISFWSFGADSFHKPFALDPIDRQFRVAISNVVGKYNIAHGPLTIDAEDEELFQRRWLTLFTKAVQKKLRCPDQMPPPESFFQLV